MAHMHLLIDPSCKDCHDSFLSKAFAEAATKQCQIVTKMVTILLAEHFSIETITNQLEMYDTNTPILMTFCHTQSTRQIPDRRQPVLPLLLKYPPERLCWGHHTMAF